jgi:hypothetical protein
MEGHLLILNYFLGCEQIGRIKSNFSVFIKEATADRAYGSGEIIQKSAGMIKKINKRRNPPMAGNLILCHTRSVKNS